MNPASVERTPPSAALDVALDLAWCHHRTTTILWKSGANAPREPCHPERSVWIRLTNPRAQPKDPYTAQVVQEFQGVLRSLVRE